MLHLMKPSEKIYVELHSPDKCHVTEENVFQSNDIKIEDKSHHALTNSFFLVVHTWT